LKDIGDFMDQMELHLSDPVAFQEATSIPSGRGEGSSQPYLAKCLTVDS